MPYTKQHSPWVDFPGTTTPILGADLDGIETGIANATTAAEAATAAAAAANAGTATNAAAIAAHLSDPSDAHDASAISIVDAGGYISGSDVETAIQELGARAVNAVTALPGSPVNGQEILFVDSLTASTYAWQFKYFSAKATNKWVYMGGSPAVHAISGSTATASTAYADLGDATGPTFTLPLAGDYEVTYGCNIRPADGQDRAGLASIFFGTTPLDADQIIFYVSSGNKESHISRTVRGTGLSASAVVKVQYKVIGGSVTFKHRWMRVTPVAVGG